MILRPAVRCLLLALSCTLASFSYGESTVPGAAVDTQPRVESFEKLTNSIHPILPGPTDGRIAWVVASMLRQFHYSQQHFDSTVSSRFLDRYLDALDSQHIYFTQQDLAEFERYRTNLDRLTITQRGLSDTRPACEIFNRFMQRCEQRVAYVDDLLQNEKFTFTNDERVVVNRHELPFPMDLAEAHRLWRERLELEYLQEKLGKDAAARKDTTAGTNKVASHEGISHHTTNPQARSAATKEVKPAVAKAKTAHEEIVETLKHRYFRNLRAYADMNDDDVLQTYLTALAHVYDPHSDYFGRQQLDSFSISMNLSLFGIGAELTSSEDGYCTIRRLLPGGPAMKSKKINEKDRIVAVAQTNQPAIDVVDMNLNKAVQLIRGPKGTEVRLTIIPAGADASTRTVVSLIRDEIPLEDGAAKARIIEMPDTHGQDLRLGVIDLPSFYAPFDVGGNRRPDTGKAAESITSKSTSADVARLITKLKQENVKGIILDLRRNGGGSLEEAIKLTGLFIKDGPVVQVKNYNGTVEEDDDKDPSILYDGPLVVLTSRLSASASEILAGALQDYGRALIIGDSSTHGKGTVQSVNPLKPYMQLPEEVMTNDPGALKVTIKKFYRPSGASTQLKGVVPDITLPSTWGESKDLGESAMENPLPYDTIKSAKYDQLNLVEPYLPELRKRSSQRVAADKEYTYIHEDIDFLRKQQADKTVSLNEVQRLKEREDIDARQKARDKERLARKDPKEKVYELTLKDAALPGLPPPLQKTNSTVASASRKPAATGTNIVASAESKTPAATSDVEDDADEEKPGPVDPALTEAEHILIDYLFLLPRNNLLTAEH